MEHSKRSVELCGWAVVYDGSAEGEERFLGFLLPLGELVRSESATKVAPSKKAFIYGGFA